MEGKLGIFLLFFADENFDKKEVVKKFDHLAKLKYSPVNPTAFTERGLYMLATILKGSVATQTTINIINTFVEIRELSRAIARVPEVVDENEKKSLLKRSGEIISNVLASDSTSLESETEIELNLAMVKIRRKIKKKVKLNLVLTLSKAFPLLGH